jgi:multicomponent K+:H+ antiporter subunit D
VNHWIIAPVVLPAVLGAATVLAGSLSHSPSLHRTWPRAITLLGSLALLGVALLLLAQASAGPPQVYRLGDWPAPFGIVLVLDRLSALMLVLTAILGVIGLMQVIATGADRRGAHFHALWLFQLMGLNGAFLTGDAFNLFVFFEVMLIASYGLMVHGAGGERLRAGLHYVAVNLVGSSLFLIALAMVYGVTGTLNMADLAVKVPALPEGDFALIRVAAVLMVMVFALKGALVPLQFWLPGTYAHAPGVVAALFAVLTKVGVYAAIRAGTLMFPAEAPAIGPILTDLLWPAALVTLLLGAAAVPGARTLARLAAFAAMSSTGLAFVAVAGFAAEGLTAGLYYVIHSTLASALLFLIADLCILRGAERLDGSTPRLPGRLAVLFFASAIASAGLPPLSGFLGKLLILEAGIDEAALLYPVVLGGSFLLVVGFARAGSALFWRAGGELAPPLPARTYLAPAALVLLMAALTIWAGPVTGWLAETAAAVTDPAAYITANALETLP